MSTSLLDRWADILVGALEQNEFGATLVRLDHAPDGDHDLGLQPIDCHPTEALAGFTAPDSCYALGVIGGGWAAPMGGKGRPSGHPDAQRIAHVVLVDRNGIVAGRVRFPGGKVMKEAPQAGAILEALRVALGLPALAA